MVQQKGKIVYTNPAGQRLFGASNDEQLFAKDVGSLISSDERESMRQKLDQALLGAKMTIPKIHLIRFDGQNILADVWLGEIIWDGKTAAQIILRAITND
ncbi:MAG: PAS domain S-box protein [Methanomicrobiales archaeon]|nr:PAS domain S-box protein [Methanomicrobiales archaeon]